MEATLHAAIYYVDRRRQHHRPSVDSSVVWSDSLTKLSELIRERDARRANECG